MNLSQLQRHFKIFGKLIYLSQTAPAHATEYRKILSGTVDQAVSGNATEASTIIKTVTPFSTAVNSLLTTLDGVPTTAKTLVETHLRQVVAVDLGLAAGAAIANVGTALNAELVAADGHVAPSGTNHSNDDGIAWYFASNFGIVLPQDADPSIPDTYIDDDVVA